MTQYHHIHTYISSYAADETHISLITMMSLLTQEEYHHPIQEVTPRGHMVTITVQPHEQGRPSLQYHLHTHPVSHALPYGPGQSDSSQSCNNIHVINTALGVGWSYN